MGFLLLTLVGAIATAQVTSEQETTLNAGLRDISAIDGELAAITRNQNVLRKSDAALQDEISSLRFRYPEIVLPPHPTVADVYHSLYAVRMARAKKLLPIAEAKKKKEEKRVCDSVNALEEKRVELEQSEGYKSASLDDRIQLRNSLDDLIKVALNANPNCQIGRP